VATASAESCRKLAEWLKREILNNLGSQSRIKLDGTITDEPDDGTFHREKLEENYSATQNWLQEFVSFLENCDGFSVVG
jgi:hypothetical protein